MKTTVKSLIVLSLIGLSAAAQAGHDGHRGGQEDSYMDWAKVTRVTPKYERVNNPRQECRDIHYGAAPAGGDGRSYGGAVIGGIAGGILGNQVGAGQGRTAATAVGAVLGAMVGDRIDNDGYRKADHRGGTRCQVIDHWENRLTGYDVEYEYNGRRYSRFMTEDPGRRLQVRVSVAPR